MCLTDQFFPLQNIRSSLDVRLFSYYQIFSLLIKWIDDDYIFCFSSWIFLVVGLDGEIEV